MSFRGALLIGVLLHVVIGLVEMVLPGIEARHLDPFLRLLPAGVTGFLFGYSGRHPTGLAGLAWGALVGGLAGFLGIALSLVLGEPEGALPALASVTGGSVLTGAAAGAAGQLLTRRRVGSPEVS